MKYKKRILAVLISILILVILFRIVDLKDITEGLKKLPLQIILMGGLFYLLSYVFRTTRFKTLNKGKINFKNLFPIVCVHNFFNSILPARTGELSYVYLLRKRKIPLGRAIGTLLIARILDILFVIIIILLAIPFINRKLGINLVNIFLPIIILAGIICIPFIVLRFKKKFVNLLRRLLSIFKFKKKMIKIITQKTEESIESIKLIKSKKVFFRSIVSTFLIIFSQFVFYYLVLQGLGIKISLLKMIIAVIIVIFVGIIPIQGIAGIGTYEGAWAISLIFLGIPKEASVTAGFVMHIMQILFFVILGIFGFLLQIIIKKAKD